MTFINNKIRQYGDNPFIISLFLAFAPFVGCLALYKIKGALYGTVLFIPIIFVFFVYLLFKKVQQESKIMKFLSATIYIVIFIFQIIFSAVIFFAIDIIDVETVYDNPKDYKKALETTGDLSHVAHFPKVIPDIAKNTVFYKKSFAIFGGDVVYLEFQAPKEYIENEIKKYDYIKISKKSIGDIKPEYFFEDGKNSQTKVDVYIKGNKSNSENCHLTCEYGIATNNLTDTIIYYLIDPD